MATPLEDAPDASPVAAARGTDSLPIIGESDSEAGGGEGASPGQLVKVAQIRTAIQYVDSKIAEERAKLEAFAGQQDGGEAVAADDPLVQPTLDALEYLEVAAIKFREDLAGILAETETPRRSTSPHSGAGSGLRSRPGSGASSDSGDGGGSGDGLSKAGSGGVRSGNCNRSLPRRSGTSLTREPSRSPSKAAALAVYVALCRLSTTVLAAPSNPRAWCALPCAPEARLIPHIRAPTTHPSDPPRPPVPSTSEPTVPPTSEPPTGELTGELMPMGGWGWGGFAHFPAFTGTSTARTSTTIPISTWWGTVPRAACIAPSGSAMTTSGSRTASASR